MSEQRLQHVLCHSCWRKYVKPRYPDAIRQWAPLLEPAPCCGCGRMQRGVNLVWEPLGEMPCELAGLHEGGAAS